MVAQSTHKTLPAMTQSSMLHVKSKSVDLDKLKLFLQLTQSTSPSHILLASLDSARYIMQQKGEELLNDVIYWCNWLRNEISDIEQIYCLSKADVGKYGIFDIDATRITVNFEKLGLNGTKVDGLLRSKFKLQIEMADLYNIVAICTIGDSTDNIKRLAESIKTIAQEHEDCKGHTERQEIKAFKNITNMELLPWEAVYYPKEDVPIERCLGRICGEMIIPYPPGIPIIVPGEVISKDIIDYALECRSKGIKINGTKDASLKYITVIK